MTACNYLRVVEHNDALDAALDHAMRVLYATPPDEFLAKRSKLAAAAKQRGDTALAQAITRLRKPTAAAWVVNAYASNHPDLVGQLADIGAALRQAQDALEVDQLRALTGERRALVGGLAKDALRSAGRSAASTALHDEVAATFDAAVADPSVAGALGVLQHAEQFSGFGFGAGPSLTLVQGGRPAPKRAEPAPPPPKRSAAEQRKLDRVVQAATRLLEDAEQGLADAIETERANATELRDFELEVEQLRRQIARTRADLEVARQKIPAARTKLRDAQAALKRAERAAAP